MLLRWLISICKETLAFDFQRKQPKRPYLLTRRIQRHPQPEGVSWLMAVARILCTVGHIKTAHPGIFVMELDKMVQSLP